MPVDFDLLKPRCDRAFARMESARSKWQEIAEFEWPAASNITTQAVAEGRKKTQRLYHSKGVTAPDKLARTMHGTVTSPAAKWFSLLVRQDELNEVKAIRDWLEASADRMYRAFGQSNFSVAAGEFYRAFVTFGTASLLLEEDDVPISSGFGGFVFTAVPIGTYAIEEGRHGKVDAMFRRLELARREAVRRWGEDCGLEFVEKARTKPDEMVWVVHAIYPRTDRDPRKPDTRNMPYADVYWLEQEKTIVREGGFPECPFMVARWDKATGEIWGTGPGHIALPDIRSLNESRFYKLHAAALAIAPATVEKHEAILSPLSLNPAARNVASGDVDDVRKVIAPIETGAKFDVAKLTEDELIQQIEDVFYNYELQLIERPNMTATEVNARIEEKQRLLGPTMGRMQSEFLGPMIERAFALMLRGGAFEPAPDELLMAGEDADIDVEYEGPLARAQRSGDLLAIERFNLYLTNVATATQDLSVYDVADFTAQAMLYAEVAGVPSDTVRDPQQVATIRQARQEAREQQQQMQTMGAVAEMAGKAAPAVRELREAAAQPAGVLA